MPAAISPGETKKWIEQALAQEPNLGLKKAVMNIVLEAPSPFDSRARRKARLGFLLGVVLFLAAAICFCYFNFAG